MVWDSGQRQCGRTHPTGGGGVPGGGHQLGARQRHVVGAVRRLPLERHLRRRRLGGRDRTVADSRGWVRSEHSGESFGGKVCDTISGERMESGSHLGRNTTQHPRYDYAPFGHRPAPTTDGYPSPCLAWNSAEYVVSPSNGSGSWGRKEHGLIVWVSRAHSLGLNNHRLKFHEIGGKKVNLRVRKLIQELYAWGSKPLDAFRKSLIHVCFEHITHIGSKFFRTAFSNFLWAKNICWNNP